MDYIKTNLLDFDITCFTETHLTVDITDIVLEEYSVLYVKLIQHILVVSYVMSVTALSFPPPISLAKYCLVTTLPYH